MIEQFCLLRSYKVNRHLHYSWILKSRIWIFVSDPFWIRFWTILQRLLNNDQFYFLFFISTTIQRTISPTEHINGADRRINAESSLRGLTIKKKKKKITTTTKSGYTIVSGVVERASTNREMLILSSLCNGTFKSKFIRDKMKREWCTYFSWQDNYGCKYLYRWIWIIHCTISARLG